MPAFGTTLEPVRTKPGYPINVNSPDGFMTDPPGDLWYWGLYDSWTASLPPALTRATALLVNPLIRMPWVLTTPDGQELRPGDQDYPTWLVDPQLLNGSTGGPQRGVFPMLDRSDRFSTFSRWITAALWVGVGLMAYSPDSNGQPLAGTVQILSSHRLFRGSDGTWAFQLADGSLEPVDERGMVAGQRLVTIRHSLPGGVLGWHRDLLRMTGKLQQYATDTFDSGVPSGVLSTDAPINQKQADGARTEWETRQQRRSVAVLGNGVRYQQITMSPLDSELVAMSRLSNEQIAHACELPGWYLDAAQSSMTYSNAQDWRRDLVDGPLASWAARLEETVSALFPWGWRMSVDFSAYTTAVTPIPTQAQEAQNAPVPSAA